MFQPTTHNQHTEPTLIAYYCQIMDRHKASPGTYGNWRSNLKYLRAYVRDIYNKEDIELVRLTKGCVEGYRSKLLETMNSHNTAAVYFAKLRACLRSAYRDGYIDHNLADMVIAVATEETERSYLTLSELRLMINTHCQLEGLRRAFLFSCLTGLRCSDLARLTWGHVVEEFGFTRIKFRQKKTRGVEYLDISPQAALLLGQRAENGERVFADFCYSSHALKRLRQWADAAGVTKHLTYHSSRHTFAVLLLSTGSDLYTVQRLLGHRTIATTQVYAHIIDSRKREAVMRIPQLISEARM